jgi:large subunit ribosomal protein L17
MRHHIQRHQLNRFTSWHKATLRDIVRSLLIQQRIFTTKGKARAAQPLAEQMITLAKDNTLAARRDAFKVLCDHTMVSLLFKEIGPRFAKRTGGYTRIMPWGRRRGDDAEIVIFELTEQKKEKKAPKKEKAAKEEAKGPIKETSHAEEARAEEKPEEQHFVPKHKTATEEKVPSTKKPTKKFLGGLRGIFKKERDSL